MKEKNTQKFVKMKSVILLIGCYIFMTACVHAVPIVGAERPAKRNIKLPQDTAVGNRNYWGNLGAHGHGGHGHGRNFGNDFNYHDNRDARKAYPLPFVFPDEFEQMRYRENFNGGQFQQRPQESQVQNQFTLGQQQQQQFFPQQQQQQQQQQFQQQQFFPQQQQVQQQQQPQRQPQRRPQQPQRQTRPTSAPTPPGYYQCTNGCLSTNEYNPICGSDEMTYRNMQRLNCAQRCGMNVRFQRIGTCRPILPIVTTCANNPNCRN